MADSNTIIHCKSLSKFYDEGPKRVQVLDDIDLTVSAGERIAIVGASGSGKSTLLNMLGGLDTPSGGSVSVAGTELTGMTDSQRGEFRNRHMGFVYQFHHLLTEFSALENVAMPLLIKGDRVKAAQQQASEMLSRVGLSGRLEHKPAELSGGERQRVAIARALVTKPSCVLMDEPTGNLDRHTAESIHQLINDLNEKSGISFIIVTHDLQMADRMDRVLTLEDGHLVANHV